MQLPDGPPEDDRVLGENLLRGQPGKTGRHADHGLAASGARQLADLHIGGVVGMGGPVRVVRLVVRAVQTPRRRFAAGVRRPGVERPDEDSPAVGVFLHFGARIEALDNGRPFPCLTHPGRRSYCHDQHQAGRQRGEAPPGMDLLFHHFRRLDLVLPDLAHGAE